MPAGDNGRHHRPLFPGKILTDDFADKEGLEMGDEYFANLDHIESVENFKEGYESEAHCSDSEGSGVDVSRLKIQPSALLAANSTERMPKKGEKGHRSHASGRSARLRSRDESFSAPPQVKPPARQGRATRTRTRTPRAKTKATARTTRL